MSGFLTEMCQGSLGRLEAARAREPEAALWARATASPTPLKLKLSPEGFDLIAECKLHSPSAGDLSAQTDGVASRAMAYGQSGAAIVSVLTEPTRFGGDLTHVLQAAQVLTPLGIPVMRKDFLVDPYQIMEARAAGASGILLIARMLDRSRLAAMLDCAAMLCLFVLIEAFDAADLEAISEVLSTRKKQKHEETILVGVNCRDLATLKVDFEQLTALAPLLPPDYPSVAESGVSSVADVGRVVELGYELALVGTMLMGSADPRKLAGELLATGRERAMAVRTREIKLATGEIGGEG
jgi:indole-3-glycerol phosphate synthase